MGFDFIQRCENALVDGQVVLDAVAVLVGLGGQRPVPGFHRIGTAGDFDDRGIIEMFREALKVDGRRSNDDFQIRPARQQRLEEAQQEVDVQRALVGLVDDDGVVLLQESIVLGLGQQDAVGHQLDQRALGALVLEAHLIADQLAQRRADFLGHASGDAARGQPTRLGVADQTVDAAADFQADLRQLSGLARAGLAGDHQYLMFLQRRLDLVALGGDRQGIVVADGRHALPARLDLGHRGLEALEPLAEFALVRFFPQLVQLPAQAMPVGAEGLVEILVQGIEGGRCVGHGQPWGNS